MSNIECRVQNLPMAFSFVTTAFSNLIVRGCEKRFQTAAVGGGDEKAVEDPDPEEDPGGVSSHRVSLPRVALSDHRGEDEPETAVHGVPGLQVLPDDLK